MSAVEWLMKCFPAVKEEDQMRSAVGRFGLTGKQQVCVVCCDVVHCCSR